SRFATGWSSRPGPRTPSRPEPPRSGAGRLPAARRPPILIATLGRLGRAGVVRRVLASRVLAPLEIAPIVVQKRPAPRTAPLLGEERFDRRDRVDLSAARPARE